VSILQSKPTHFGLIKRVQLLPILFISIMVIGALALLCISAAYLYLVQSTKNPLPTLPSGLDTQFSQNRQMLAPDAIDSTVFPIIVGDFKRTERVRDGWYNYQAPDGTIIKLIVRLVDTPTINQAALTDTADCGDFVLPSIVHLNEKFPFSLSSCGGLHFSWYNGNWFIEAVTDRSLTSPDELVRFVNSYPN
jgi:hypothetical protein